MAKKFPDETGAVGGAVSAGRSSFDGQGGGINLYKDDDPNVVASASSVDGVLGSDYSKDFDYMSIWTNSKTTV